MCTQRLITALVALAATASPSIPGEAVRVAASGDHAFVANGLSGSQMFAISDPTDPTLVGSYESISNAFDVAVSGDLAFVVNFYDLRRRSPFALRSAEAGAARRAGCLVVMR